MTKPAPARPKLRVHRKTAKPRRDEMILRQERSPLNPVLSWHVQRNQWNAEGFCPRAACGPGRGGRGA